MNIKLVKEKEERNLLKELDENRFEIFHLVYLEEDGDIQEMIIHPDENGEYYILFMQEFEPFIIKKQKDRTLSQELIIYFSLKDILELKTISRIEIKAFLEE